MNPDATDSSRRPVDLTQRRLEPRNIEGMPLREAIECHVNSLCGSTESIVSLVREPNPYASLSPSEVVQAQITSGVTLLFFLKPLGVYEEAHPDKAEPNREHDVYLHLLSGACLPVPQFLGCVNPGGDCRRALLIDFFPALSLRYLRMPAWHAAIRALARLHAHFASHSDQLFSVPALLRLDDAYHRAWCARALDVVGSRSAGLGHALEQSLLRYDSALTILRSQPVTLVHNDLAPKNVLVAEDGATSVRIVDWELAGVGAAMLDLVHLTSGLSSDAEAQLVESYLNEFARSCDIRPAIEGDVSRLMSASKAQKTIYKLARSFKWHLPDETIRRWTQEVGALLESV